MGREVLLAFNTSSAPITRNVHVEPGSRSFTTLAGKCAARATGPGSVTISLPALGYAIREAGR